MVTLRAVIDQIVAPVPGGIGRYAEELTRQIVARAPQNCDVIGVTSRLGDSEHQRLQMLLPGLTAIEQHPLPRRALAVAWQAGLALPRGGMVHAMSLLAPLRKHDRVTTRGNQTVVTIYDVIPWTHPETLTPRGVRWH